MKKYKARAHVTLGEGVALPESPEGAEEVLTQCLGKAEAVTAEQFLDITYFTEF